MAMFEETVEDEKKLKKEARKIKDSLLAQLATAKRNRKDARATVLLNLIALLEYDYHI